MGIAETLQLKKFIFGDKNIVVHVQSLGEL